jgi:putative methionine-R-sulfoxide reductase with GAF domain
VGHRALTLLQDVAGLLELPFSDGVSTAGARRAAEITWSFMGSRLNNALSRLADSGMHVHFVSWVGILAELLLVGGPVVMGLLSIPAISGLAWAAKASMWAAVLTGVGWLGTKGAAWLRARRRRRIDVEHSADVSASLRALQGVVLKTEDPVVIRKHILSCITRTAARVCPRSDADLFACLLRPEGTALKMMEYTDFRGGRVPSATIAFDAKDGAAKSYRDGKMSYVADTASAEDAAAFVGKSYRCILSFPLLENGSCVGVVSIDSTIPNHFDDHLAEIGAHVLPFVEILHLNVSLAERAPRRRAKGAQ